MRSFLGATAFVWLHMMVALGLGFMGLGMMVLLADLAMPDQTGWFVVNNATASVGVLAHPVGEEVLGTSVSRLSSASQCRS